MTTLYFVKAEKNQEDDNTCESTMYFTRFATPFKDEALMLAFRWNMELSKRSWFQKFFSDIHHFRVIEVETSLDLSYTSSVFINFRTLEVSDATCLYHGALLSEVFLGTLYKKGLSIPHMTKV
jgi:hypothetical protein